MNGDRWIDDRLASLDKGEEIMIEPTRILGLLQAREQARLIRRTRLIGAGVFGFVACAGVASVITVRKPEPPKPPASVVVSAPLPITTTAEQPDRPVVPNRLEAKAAKPIRLPQSRVTAAPLTAPRGFKETGSPAAQITVELYMDFECPPCATFYNQTMPQIVSDYVDTGKVKLLRRDFPLPQHKYARLAARYANAAGLIGKYNEVSDQIIKSQSIWHQDGDVDSQVAAVLSPVEMQNLRKVMKDSAEPEESIARDRAVGADDHVEQTPSLVLIANGHRRKVTGTVSLAVIRSYLDELLAQ